MFCVVLMGSQRLEIARIIIPSGLVIMMNVLSADVVTLGVRDQSVLISIAANVGQRMSFTNTNQNIAARIDNATTAPIRIVRPKASVRFTHRHSPPSTP